ncbi:MAG: amidase [Acidobacteria bacterium]|nr:amidase [Acidobacteriota bacterium]
MAGYYVLSMTATERVDAALTAIATHNARTNAFIVIDAEGARAQASAADAETASGVNRGPLHGVPVSVKDLIDIAGQVTTAGSQVLADNVAAADAPVITRLRGAGAVIVGKANLHEFALGTTCEDSGFGPVRHPLDPSRSPGGSSGGSAVSVATGMSDMSVGSDTGGSIRIPASICGLVGLKPSINDVPTAGTIPLSTTFDHIGPITRSVADAAALWRVLADRPQDIVAAPAVRDLRLAVLGGYFMQSLQADVRTAFDHACDNLRGAGVAIGSRLIDNTDTILDTYVRIVLSEAAVWHAKYLDTRGDRYRPNVRARLLAGRDFTAVDYLGAHEACEAFRDAIDEALDGIDALILPTLPILAPTLGQAELTIDGAAVPVRAAMLRNTQLFNMTGHPAISLPMTMPAGTFPAGLQIVGRLDATATLLAIAATCEKIIR